MEAEAEAEVKQFLKMEAEVEAEAKKKLKMEVEAEAEAKKILKMEAEAEAVQKFGASTSLLGTLCGVRFSTVTLPLFPLPWLQILCQCYPIMQLLGVGDHFVILSL